MLLGSFAAVLVCLAVGTGGTPGAPCWGGRPWAAGNWSCVAPEPYLIFGLGNALFRMDLDGGDQRRILATAGPSLLLDFHYAEDRVYWADTHAGVINRAGLDGSQRQKLFSLEKGISGLAVDWIRNSVFWTNQEKGTIHRVDTDGKNERTLLRHLSQPSSVVIDPNDRFIFWLSDGITPSIQRSDVDGEMSTTVMKVPDRLATLTVDHADRRLFWVQLDMERRSAIGSCDYNGNVINVIEQPLRSKALRMSVFLDYVYLTEATSKSITRVNKYTGGLEDSVNSKPMLHPPADVRVVHPLTQPVVESASPLSPGCDSVTGKCVSVCSSPSDPEPCHCRDGFTLSQHGNHCEDVNECALWNHGCSLGCENVPGSYFCTCPEGYLLLPNIKTCHVAELCVENATLCDHACVHTLEGDVCVCPEGSILQPDGRSCTGCSSADRGGCCQVCVPLSPGRWACECQPGYQLQPDGKHCTATGPPPYLLFANVVDVRRVNMDGTGGRSLLEPRGTVIALDYDPVQNRVYFASTGLKQIERAALDGGSREVLVSAGLDSPEGLAVDWIHRKLYWTDRGLSTISRSSLNGLDREVIINKDIQNPRGIAIHPQTQRLFWTDMGSRPVVESASLSGGQRAVVASAGLVWPSGLALDHSTERLYWCDLRRGAIESAALDGSHRRLLTENQVGRPFALAVFEDLLWVSDWEGHLLFSLDKRSGGSPERLHTDAVQPAALVIVHPLAKPGADLCLYQNGGCAQVCQSRLGLAHCSCHSQYIQSADGKACLPADGSFAGTESSDGESSDRLSLKNKTLNDESSPLAVPDLPHREDGKDGPTLFTEKMVSDQDDCYSLRCDVNAQCLLEEGSAACQCLNGFTGDGELCVDIDECSMGLAECSSVRSECVNTVGGYFCQCRAGFSGDGHHCTDIDECKLERHGCDVHAECLNTVGTYLCKCTAGYTGTGFTCQEVKAAPFWVSTGSPLDVTPPWQNSDIMETCPSSHDSYCLYEGVCFYFPEMESYACNCISGYMGERCQFSDLEWWELQQAEQEKRRNVAIAVCMVLLITLLSIAACITYRYGSRRFSRKHHPSVDDMSETSTSEESITEMTTANTPRFYVVLEHGACGDGKLLHVVGCQRRTVCPSCSSETGESLVSEEAGTLPRDHRGSESGPGQTTGDACRPGVHLKAIDNLIFLDDPRPPTPNLI